MPATLFVHFWQHGTRRPDHAQQVHLELHLDILDGIEGLEPPDMVAELRAAREARFRQIIQIAKNGRLVEPFGDEDFCEIGVGDGRSGGPQLAENGDASGRRTDAGALQERPNDAHLFRLLAPDPFAHETIHSFVDASAYSGAFLPGYEAVGEDTPARGLKPLWSVPAGQPVGLTTIDHVVANVELGKMNEWARFYARVLGFDQLVHFRDDQISSEYTALMSKVMWDGKGRVKLPINEPAPGKKKSPIAEYLEFYRVPGVQHIAMLTDDIVASVDSLRLRGVRFIRVPETYYQSIREKVGEISEDWSDIERLNVLADRDDEGYLLQIFTKNVQDRPTVFYEIIERRGSKGFGLGNFKELFLAIEREQAERGNL